ncbi:MAG: UDP-N-acetylglucosamine 2-epimerase (non-hydrolyzing) [candidate division Zixibacteria bacterium]|nr:UDP-N-acetylglucosamine 2-epimerase (non-hydrolyzing) [candidate division Zixibacteria bacterium]
MKIISVVGARPQFIKLSSLSKELRKKHREVILHTGQHYDDELSRVFFSELSIPKPDYNLGIGSAEHGEQTGKMLKSIEEVLTFEKPDLVIVYGDTNSTLAGALAAAKQNIPVAHVEAGLRSFVKSMPEEINRILTDHVSSLLFCPTPTSVRNLKREGITKGVHLVGDVMYDSLRENLSVAEKKSKIMKRLNLQKEKFYLITVHRAENTDIRQNLKRIIQIATNLDKKVVFPIHPRTRKRLSEFNFLDRLLSKSDLLLIDPVSYLDMLVLEKNARYVLTDSGGVQKEAYFLRTPCLTLREETEWVETLGSNCNQVVGLSLKKVLMRVRELKNVGLDSDRKNELTVKGAKYKIALIISRPVKQMKLQRLVLTKAEKGKNSSSSDLKYSN